jgi:hypothetical protein
MGRVYTMTGDPTKAKAADQDFFHLWKGSDPDIVAETNQGRVRKVAIAGNLLSTS